MVNVYVEHISYFHKPRADGWMMHVCIILSLRLMLNVYYLNDFISLILMLSLGLMIHA